MDYKKVFLKVLVPIFAALGYLRGLKKDALDLLLERVPNSIEGVLAAFYTVEPYGPMVLWVVSEDAWLVEFGREEPFRLFASENEGRLYVWIEQLDVGSFGLEIDGEAVNLDDPLRYPRRIKPLDTVGFIFGVVLSRSLDLPLKGDTKHTTLSSELVETLMSQGLLMQAIEALHQASLVEMEFERAEV